VEEGGDAPESELKVADGVLKIKSNKSNSPIKVTGPYNGEDSKTYTFKVEKRGNVGITPVLFLNWEDTFGNSGKMDIGRGYVPGTPIFFDSGLSLALGEGELYKNDEFLIETRTSTVRKAQDLVLRLGATRTGGGLEVRRDVNKVNDIVKGLDLEFFSSSEDLVTISVIGDTEKATEKIADFVDAYNTFSTTAKEMAKFDKASNTAAPLLSDRTLAQAVNEIATTSIATVQGLPQTDNMLFSVGIRLNDQGSMTIDRKKLNEKVQEDFATVANLFRSYGSSDQSGITFVGSTDKTQISSDGYKIDVKQVAEKGYYLGTPLPPMITINGENDIISIISGGRSSDPLNLRHDIYSPSSLAKQIQNRINDDKVLGRRGIQVREEDGRIKIISGNFGSRSKIEIEAGKDRNISSLGLIDGASVPGIDVDGTIDGIQATGRGQLLVGTEETSTEGLRVYVNLDENELLPGKEEARVKLTKGIAVKLGGKLKRMNDPVSGDVKKVTTDITDQIGNYDEQLTRLGERMEDKHKNLQIKFAKLDSTMGRLRSQQNYVSQQLSALSNSPRGGGKDK
ncbi:MAG: flagellar filament capping protein FliD, partial [SAR324 cluster bacterium]|nr:flagellar filament capping protein FliD [SAR324 cluster bacterium]